MMRLTSSRSSTSRVSCATCRLITSRARRTCSGCALARPMIASALAIGASGLRNSWPSIARNSVMRRPSSSRLLMRRLSVRSRVTLAKPRARRARRTAR